MDKSEKDKYIIEKYQEEERAMVLVFAQWCVNHDIEPLEFYAETYPEQAKNPLLTEALEQTVEKKESEDISHDMLIQILQAFGNDDLAFEVQAFMDRQNKKA